MERKSDQEHLPAVGTSDVLPWFPLTPVLFFSSQYFKGAELRGQAEKVVNKVVLDWEGKFIGEVFE